MEKIVRKFERKTHERENVISEDSGNNDFSREQNRGEALVYILRAAEVGSSDGQRRVRRDDVRPRYVKPLPPTRPSTRAPHCLSHLLRFHIHIARKRARAPESCTEMMWETYE